MKPSTLARCSKNLVERAIPGVILASFDGRQFAAGDSPNRAVITFLGHASYMIDTPQGVRAITDYNEKMEQLIQPSDIVTKVMKGVKNYPNQKHKKEDFASHLKKQLQEVSNGRKEIMKELKKRGSEIELMTPDIEESIENIVLKKFNYRFFSHNSNTNKVLVALQHHLDSNINFQFPFGEKFHDKIEATLCFIKTFCFR